MQENKFTARVTQYLRPDGRIRHETTRLPIEYAPLYLDMIINSKCLFTAEVLMDGNVSLAISDGEKDISIRIVPNGPEAQEALIEMLKEERWKQDDT